MKFPVLILRWGLSLLYACALGVSQARASDGCSFQWKGGSGDVGEKNNWDYGDCFPDPSLLPGPMDGVSITGVDRDGNPTPITITGDLNVEVWAFPALSP